jgi:acyl-CoA thioesterase
MTPSEIFHRMFDNDPFSRELGMELVAVDAGSCTLRMTVKPFMLNGFGVAHGGITFALADSALAFASNSRGRHAVSVHCSIEHVAPVVEGDVLTATATEDKVGNAMGHYNIRVEKQDGTPVAFFRGMVYRKSREWE